MVCTIFPQFPQFLTAFDIGIPPLVVARGPHPRGIQQGRPPPARLNDTLCDVFAWLNDDELAVATVSHPGPPPEVASAAPVPVVTGPVRCAVDGWAGQRWALPEIKEEP